MFGPPPHRLFVVTAAVAATATAMASLLSCSLADTQTGRPKPDTDRTPVKRSMVPGLVAAMSPQEKVGQLFVPAFGTRTQALALIRRYHVGGLIYFPRGTPTARRTAALSNTLQNTSKIPLLISVDEEQGTVSRLPYITRLPGNMAIGATGDPAAARAAAHTIGAELRAVGINQDYAPVADVNVDPANPVIGTRSYGSDPDQVARLTGAAVDGFRSAGVIATAKHFPGHGDTATDSHTGLPVIGHSRTRWERLDAPPFRAAIAHQVDAIMSAHIVVRGLDRSGDPATLSGTVLTKVLRGELGYQGVIVTDSLRMAGARYRHGEAGAAVRALRAGADQLLMPQNVPKVYAAVLGAVRTGVIPQARVDDAVTRVLRLKEQRGLFGRPRADPARADAVIGSAAHKAAARRIAERSITLVRNEGGLLPLRGRTVHVTGAYAAAVATALRRQGVRLAGRADTADVTIVTTWNARAATARLIRAQRGRPVVVVALGLPYDLTYAGAAQAALATYSAGSTSIAALAKVLTGAVRPSGRLPVTIPHAYDLGHGLTFS